MFFADSATTQSAQDVFSKVLSSVGYELVIFFVTLVLALAFRGATSGKAKSLAKSLDEKSLKPRKTAAQPCDTSEATSLPQGQRSEAVCAGQEYPTTLSQKVECLVHLANKRHAAEAIALYEELTAGLSSIKLVSVMEAISKPADVFTLLVQCAGRMGRSDLMEVFLRDMTAASVERTLAFYESTMKLLASKKCYKEAMSVFQRLKGDGLEPSPATLSCVVSFAVEVGEPDQAIDYFQQLSACSTPSIRAYMTILRVHAKRANWSQSLALVRDMQAREAPIDSLVLNIALSTGASAGQLAEAKSLLQELSAIGVGDVISYNTIMKGFAQQKNGNAALQLLDEMAERGIKPNAITFNTAMDATIRSSQVADAWRVLARMCDAGLAPDKFTCTTLMKGLSNGASSKQLSVILDLLRNVTRDCDRNLCSNLFKSVIEAAVQVNDPDLTARAVAQMREQRVMLPPQEYNRLLNALLHCGDSKRSTLNANATPFASMQTGFPY